MQYQEAVAEFVALDETIESGQWRQAQIAHDQIRPRGKVSQEQFAGDVHRSEAHVKALVRLWKEHSGRSASLRPSFADAYRMAETRTNSPEAASAVKDANRAASALDKVGPISRAGIIREHLANPEVAREVFNAPQPDDQNAAKARMYAGNAITEHDQRTQRHVQEKRHEEYVTTERTEYEGTYEVASMMQALAGVVVAGGKLARKLSDGATLNARTRQSLSAYATKAKATIEWLEGIEQEQHADDLDEVLRVWAAEA